MSLLVSTIKNKDEFLALYKEWVLLHEEASEKDFYFTYDWYCPLLRGCKYRPGQLVVFTFRYGGILQGLIPCYLKNTRGRFLPIKTLGLYGNIYSARRGATIRKGYENLVINAFVDYLCNDFKYKWDIIEFSDLSQNDKIVCTLYDILSKRRMKPVFQKQYENVRTYYKESN